MTALKELLRERGISQSQLAEAVGVSNGAVSLWVAGKIQPKTSSLVKIAQYLNVPVTSLLDTGITYALIKYPSEPKKAYAPLLGRVHAGDGSEPDVLEEKVPVPYEVLKRHPQAFLLEVEGDCMNKVLPPGCLVMVDPMMQPANRSIAVVSIEEDYIVRRITRGADTLLLSPESTNKVWRDVVVQNDKTVELVGTVVWYQPPEELA